MIQIRLKRNLTILLFIAALVNARSQNWSIKLQEKIHTTVASVFTDASKTYQQIKPAGTSIPRRADGFYKIETGIGAPAWMYVGQAESMKNVFDFIIIFDQSLTVIKSKVLIYREQHGAQIATVRWLSQFDGMKAGNKISLGSEVDGISGATISANNMTNAVSEVLQALAFLRDKGHLK